MAGFAAVAAAQCGVLIDLSVRHFLALNCFGRLLVGLAALSLLFVTFPGLDIAFSSLFAGRDGGFPLAASPGLQGLRSAASGVTIALVAISASTLAIWLFRRRVSFILLHPSEAAFLLLVQVLGPGLLVNAVLKESFGRARPRDVAEFGGGLPFTAAWEPSTACLANCSFTSGEAAAAMAMLSVMFVLPAEARRWVRWVLVPFIVAVSLNRIAFGGHFLSDVLLSWLLVALVIEVLARAFLRKGQADWIDRTLTGALEPSGERMRRWITGRVANLPARIWGAPGAIGASAFGKRVSATAPSGS